MWTLIVEGGLPMWFLLIFGLATWVAAGAFARRKGDCWNNALAESF